MLILTWVVITCKVMAFGENWVLKHQTSQCFLKIHIAMSICNFIWVHQPLTLWLHKYILHFHQILQLWPRLRVSILTRKSPPHSCKQCKTSSWLVPPPLSTLEQAMFIKSSTRKQKSNDVRNNMRVCRSKWGGEVKYPLLSLSPCLRCELSTGSQTRSALCWSSWEEGWSCNSGISAWYSCPMLIRLNNVNK